MKIDLESKREDRRNQKAVSWPIGLGSLFLQSYQRVRSVNRESDVIKILIEEYWIRQLIGIGQINISSSGSSMSLLLPRSLLPSKNVFSHVNTEGDGIHFEFNGHSEGALAGSGNIEWFEVTEVFRDHLVAKDIRAFRNFANGYNSYAGFDPRKFLESLNMSTPSQGAQDLVACKVLKEIQKKLKSEKYQRTYQEFGYGTLIVGIPLWFVMCYPSDIRAECQGDFFIRILDKYLKPVAERIEAEDCPFRSIVVVWTPSLKSVHDWQSLAKRSVHRGGVLTIMVRIADVTKVKPGMPRDMRLSIRIDSTHKNLKQVRFQDVLK